MKLWYIFIFIWLFPQMASAGEPASLIEKFFVEIEPKLEEMSLLREGNIVVRPSDKKILGGVAFMLVTAPSWKVWQVITDYPKYREFMPKNLESKVLGIDQGKVHFRSVYSSGFAFPNIWNESLVEEDTHDPKNLIMVWHAQRTNLNSNYGFWQIKENGDKTLVIYTNYFDIPFVPMFLARSGARNSLENTLKAVRKRLENERYAQNPEQLTWIWLEKK